MSVSNKPHYAFVAGEVAPSYYGRTDLTKYELGVAKCENFFVDYRGGLISRPGTKFVGPMAGTTDHCKFFRFGVIGDDYIVVATHQKLRFIRDGGYLLNAAVPIESIAGDGSITITGHPYVVGDLVYLSGIVGTTEYNDRYLIVETVAANSFTLKEAEGETVTAVGYSAYVSGGTVSSAYTIASPFAGSKLEGLRLRQRSASSMIFTSLDYPRHRLVYNNDTSWVLTEIATANTVPVPTGLTLVPNAVGTAGTMVAITAVVDGVESVASDYVLVRDMVDYTVTDGSLLVTWDRVNGAQSYNVYRSLVLPNSTDLTRGQQLGYIGSAFGPQFTDNNITPDFTKAPPNFTNPFASAGVTSVEVTASGTGYTNETVVNVTGGGGTGYKGFVIVNAAGELLSVVTTDPGSGYSNPVVSFTVGTGAAATASLTKATGNHPQCLTVFQQREVYAGTTNAPMDIWATVPRADDNFNVSQIVNAGDAYSYTIDSVETKPIRHLVSLRAGLLAFTAQDITLLRAEEGKTVSAVNALAEPQAYKGASAVEPISIGLDVLFSQNNSTALNAMIYTEYTNAFSLQDVAILSAHLLGEGRSIKRMEWMPEPWKRLYCLLENGEIATLTYERDQEVFGWTPQRTRGLYRDIIRVNEEDRDTMYYAVRRYLSGRWVTTIEVEQRRDRDVLETHWGVDCGLNYTLAKPSATISIIEQGNKHIVTSTAGAPFTEEMVGQHIYVGGSKLRILSRTSSSRVVTTAIRPITSVLPYGDAVPYSFEEGNWTVGAEVSVLENLWHLEGERVSLLCDGQAYTGLTVTNGSLTLPTPGTEVIVGLAYDCLVKTLPVELLQEYSIGRRKDILGVSTRVKDTRGLEVGSRMDQLVEFKDRSIEAWGNPLTPASTQIYAAIDAGWEEDASLYYRQAYPLPATLLSLAFDIDVGDD